MLELVRLHRRLGAAFKMKLSKPSVIDIFFLVQNLVNVLKVFIEFSKNLFTFSNCSLYFFGFFFVICFILLKSSCYLGNVPLCSYEWAPVYVSMRAFFYWKRCIILWYFFQTLWFISEFPQLW